MAEGKQRGRPKRAPQIITPFSLNGLTYNPGDSLKDFDKDRIEDLKKRGLIK